MSAVKTVDAARANASATLASQAPDAKSAAQLPPLPLVPITAVEREPAQLENATALILLMEPTAPLSMNKDVLTTLAQETEFATRRNATVILTSLEITAKTKFKEFFCFLKVFEFYFFLFS